MSGPPAPPAATPGQAMRATLINRWTARGHCVDGRSWDLLPQVDRDDLDAAAQAAIARYIELNGRDPVDFRAFLAEALSSTPPRPLTAPDVVASLLADVADARAQLAEVTAERDRLRTDLADAEKADDDLVSEILRNMREEDGDDIAPGALCVRYVRSLEAGREKLLAANQRWAETLGDVQQRHAEVKRQRDDARKAFATLAGRFTQGAQSGWTARVSGTVLRRLCVTAMCEPPSGATDNIEAAAMVLFRDYESQYQADHLTWRDFADLARAVIEAA